MQLLLWESGVEEAQCHILCSRAGQINLCKRIAHLGQALKSHVPDPTDIAAILRPVVETCGKDERRPALRQETQHLVAACRIFDQNHAHIRAVDLKLLHAPETTGKA